MSTTAPKDRNIGMVFGPADPNLSVFESIAFPAAAQKPEKDEIVHRVNSCQIVHLVLKRMPSQLPAGQQRVAMCRALVKIGHPAFRRADVNLDARPFKSG